MVLQAQHHTALGRLVDTLAEAVDDPAEAFFVGLAINRWFDTAVLHQLVETLAGAPPAGVEPHAWDAEIIGEFNAFDGVVDVSLAFFLVGRNETLMYGKRFSLKSLIHFVLKG